MSDAGIKAGESKSIGPGMRFVARGTSGHVEHIVPESHPNAAILHLKDGGFPEGDKPYEVAVAAVPRARGRRIAGLMRVHFRLGRP